MRNIWFIIFYLESILVRAKILLVANLFLDNDYG